MAKLSNKQKKELKVLEYFIPIGSPELTEQEVDDFFAWSSTGKNAKTYKARAMKNQAPLYWAKNRRDLQITYYKEDWGDTLNAWSFNDEPKWYAEWVAKKLNKPMILTAWEYCNEGRNG